MAVALYCRVSTDEQAQGFSILHQTERMEAFCASQGWPDYELFVDDGWTGTSLKRPGLARLLQQIKAGCVHTVLVYKLDRLSRRQKDVLYLLEDVFEKHRVAFRSVTEPFDTSTPFGKAMLGMLAVFAQLERDTIVERSRFGKHQRTRNGLWYGGPEPYGYQWSAGEQQLIPNPVQAELVRQMFQRFLGGQSALSLAKWMAERSGDRQFRNHKSLMYMLENPVYAGMLRQGSQLVNGLHEAIVDPETWRQVQVEIEHRRSGRSATGRYLLSRLLVCGVCGSPMKHIRATDRRSDPPRQRNYYLCSRKHHKTKSCNSKYYPQEALEQAVIARVKRLAISPSWIESEMGAQTQYSCDDATTTLEEQLQSIEKKLEKWYDAFETGAVDKNQLRFRIESLERQQSAALLHLEEARQRVLALPRNPSLPQIHFVSEVWSALTNEERALLIRAAVSKIAVYPNPEEPLQLHWNV